MLQQKKMHCFLEEFETVHALAEDESYWNLELLLITLAGMENSGGPIVRDDQIYKWANGFKSVDARLANCRINGSERVNKIYSPIQNDHYWHDQRRKEF